MARTSPEQMAQQETDAYKKHVVGKIRAEWGDSVPGDADDDEVLTVWRDLNAPPDATTEDINDVLQETYAQDYTPPKFKDERTFMEKAEDVGKAVGPMVGPIAANIGAAVSSAAPGMRKVAGALGKTAPAQLGMAGYYGTRLAGAQLAADPGKLEGLPVPGLGRLATGLEQTAERMPVPNVEDLKRRGYSAQQIRNILKGYADTQQSLMQDIGEVGKEGARTGVEAVANALVMPMTAGAVENVAGNLAGRAAMRGGASSVAGQAAAKIAGRGAGGALLGGTFGGTANVIERATEMAEQGGSAEEVLGYMTNGVMGSKPTPSEGGDTAPNPFADFGQGFGDTWAFGAAFGGAVGAVESAAQIARGVNAGRKLRAAEEVKRARTLAVQKTADEFVPDDLVQRFERDLIEADEAGLSDVALATNLMTKLHPDMVSTEEGLKAIAQIAEKIRPWRSWKAHVEEGIITPTRVPTSPVETPEGFVSEAAPPLPGQGPEIGPAQPPVPMAPEVVAPGTAGPVRGMAPEPNAPAILQGPLGAAERQDFVPPAGVRRTPLEPALEAPGIVPVTPEITPEVRVPTGQAELAPTVVAPPAHPRGVPPENLPPAVQGPLGSDRPVPFAPPSGVPQAEGIEFGKLPRGIGLAQDVTRQYLRSVGRESRPPVIKPVDKALGARIAKEYEKLPVTPTGREAAKAKASYDALNREIAEQYRVMQDAGIKVEFVDRDPYASSAEMRADVARGVLKVLKSQPDQAHPYMTPEQTNLFRAVHDFYGHSADALEFGAMGEDNAWRAHARMFSDEAIPALTTETRGQNSWVNFTKGHEALPASERPFAKQKFGLLPEWTYEEVLRKEGNLPITPGVKTRKVDDHILIEDVQPSKGMTTQQGIKAVLAEADKKGLPVQVRIEPQAGPKGGMIPVEKQVKWYEKQGFKVTEQGEGFATARREPALVPPPSAELVGEHMHRVATGLHEMAFRAQHRLESRRGRLMSGIDPADIRDYSLVLASDMFSRGLRTKAELTKWAVEKWGADVEPVVEKVVAAAQKHFVRMFKTPGQASKNLKTLLDLGVSGRHGAEWYEGIADWAQKNVGDDADMFLRFLAVTSANGQTESGVAMALKAFAQWRAGMPFEGFRGHSMVGQLERAAKGEKIGDEFSKIEQFYQALSGNPDAIVLDRWMMDALNLKDRGGALRENDYRIYAQVVEDLAEMNGMTPRQFQAAVWEGARIRKAHMTEKSGGRALTTRSGSARPFEDLIERKLAGMTIDEYVAAHQGSLQKMGNLYSNLAPVRLGESSGYTFNPKTWTTSTEDGFTATLATTVVPKNELYPASVLKFAKHFEQLMQEYPGKFTIGVFKMPDGNFSIDLNLMTKDKAEALRLAFKNRQHAIGELANGGEYQGDIPTGYNPKKHGPQFLPPTEGSKQAPWFKGTAARIRNYLRNDPSLFEGD